MGIWCEINFDGRPNNRYKPGDIVHGKVKYVLNEDTHFKRITASLKGYGILKVEWLEHTGKFFMYRSYKKVEDFVNIDTVVHDNIKNAFFSAGPHEIPFSFELPQNIPPSFRYDGNVNRYDVKCEILYYVRIKFERSGMFQLQKKFKAKINVDNVVVPTLPTFPIIHGQSKVPFQPFSSNKAVKIRCTVENSVIIVPGGRLIVNYEVANPTNLDISAVKVKLIQELRFKRYGITYADDCIESKTLGKGLPFVLKAGSSQTMDLTMDVPSGYMTIQNSKQVFRDYFLTIKAVLPFPHRDVFLKVPLEIIDLEEDSNEATKAATCSYEDAPPSYSEVMAEYKKKIDLE